MILGTFWLYLKENSDNEIKREPKEDLGGTAYVQQAIVTESVHIGSWSVYSFDTICHRRRHRTPVRDVHRQGCRHCIIRLRAF